jgi:hypothetical protein
LSELLNRQDAGKLILNYYKKIDLNKITTISQLAERGEFVAKVFYLELFLSHPNILNQFQGNEKELIKAILLSHDICSRINSETRSDIYDGYAIGTKALALGRVLDRLKGRKTNNQAKEEMNLDRLTMENYKRIIEEARSL